MAFYNTLKQCLGCETHPQTKIWFSGGGATACLRHVLRDGANPSFDAIEALAGGLKVRVVELFE